jgi:surface polysaccharide O-acyltransferase-like enzyme
MAAKKERQSNIELLRIIAMFLVMVVHANVFSLGLPTYYEYSNAPISSFTRILIESLAIVSVNVFVLISGWFGIHPSLKGFAKFIFQCLFFSIGIYLISVIVNHSSLSMKGLAECLFLTQKQWFIKAYIALYILSPILNVFVEQASKQQLRKTILFFYAFQTIYGFTNAAAFIVYGYSTFSFIGLYLLARYVNTYYTACCNKLGGG